MAAGELLVDTNTADSRPPPRRLDRAGQVRPDRLDHDADRRDLQVQSVAGKLRDRRPVLPFPLRQPASGCRPARHGARRPWSWRCAEQRAAALRERGVQDAGPVRSLPAGERQPAARAGLRAPGTGDPDRADRHRQHADAVSVRAHPRDRTAAGGGDEAPTGPGDDPLGGRHRRAVRRRGGDAERDGSGHRSGLRAAQQRRHERRRSDPQPGRLRDPRPACSAWPPPPGPPAAPPTSTSWPRSPPSDRQCGSGIQLVPGSWSQSSPPSSIAASTSGWLFRRTSSAVTSRPIPCRLEGKRAGTQTRP